MAGAPAPPVTFAPVADEMMESLVTLPVPLPLTMRRGACPAALVSVCPHRSSVTFPKSSGSFTAAPATSFVTETFHPSVPSGLTVTGSPLNASFKASVIVPLIVKCTVTSSL